MPKIPPQKYRTVIQKLRKIGFVFRRATGGSHKIKSGTLGSIVKQIGITSEAFIKIGWFRWGNVPNGLVEWEACRHKCCRCK